MVLLYRDIFVMICFGLLGWGLIRAERIYQYPFFMGSIFVSFVLPQVFALIDNPVPLTSQGLERVLLMSCLCAAACWLGYQIPVDSRLLKNLDVELDPSRLRRGGFVLLAIGWLCSIMLGNIDIETSASAGGNWTGKATILYFFGQVIYIAFSIFVIEALKKPTINNITYAILAGWIPLQTVLKGRRQPTMTFVIIIGLGVWTIYRRVPPRWMIIIGLVLSIVLIPTLGVLRDEFWSLLFTGQWDLLITEGQNSFSRLTEGDVLELRNAAVFMDVAVQKNLYGLGAGWWDNVVFQYVPGQIVGYGFKRALQFNLITSYDLYEFHQYINPTGSTMTGIGDAFVEFGYIGSLTFAAIGYVCKCFWISGSYHNSIGSILLYTSLVSPAMVGITHGIGRFWQELIIKVIVIGCLIFYAKMPPHRPNAPTSLK